MGRRACAILQTRQRIDLLSPTSACPASTAASSPIRRGVTRPDLKVLFMTGYAESAAMTDGIREAGMEMITKPFELDNLSRRIRAMVAA